MTYPRLTDKPGALETAAAIRAGDMSPHEAVEDAIARIEKLDAHVNAVAVCDFERAIATAKAMDGQKPSPDQPVFGVPMTIKESFEIAGLPSCWGHQEFAGNIAAKDSVVVRQLKAAGAVFLGKTNVPVDLTDWQSLNPVYGRTNNPHDHDRSAGGSSGGSAAAVASGMVPCDFGTDIGGSVRVPAHFNGVWGHKTTWGLVSKHGHDHPMMAGKGAHDGVLSIAGPLARNGDDLQILTQLTASVPLRERTKPLKDCRFLLLVEHPISEVDNDVRGLIEGAAKAIESAGARVDHATSALPDLKAQNEDYMRMLGVAMARGAPGPDGKSASATDWFNLLDQQARNELAWEVFFQEYDFVLAPPAPIVTFEHRDKAFFEGDVTINDKVHRAADGLAWAGLATFPNLPATVLPVGDVGGLPCGMQVMGPKWSDLDCIAAATEIGALLHS
ncbi:amidase family protein [Qipengyuania sp. DGS5-3]|uniref:amidase family protein n=1 Tax=Qipengyuania sp. DGS5-3 TaxID=3349632 RepID=UPI0036D2300F